VLLGLDRAFAALDLTNRREQRAEKSPKLVWTVLTRC
jgi:hypothetical protein